MNKLKRSLWQNPWGYAESFIIASGLLLIGLVLEISAGRGSSLAIRFPLNLIIGAIFTGLAVSCYYLFRNRSILKFLTGVPATIGAVSLLTFLVIIMEIIPQGVDSSNQIVSLLGLNRMTSSWAFLFLNIYFLLILLWVILKRSFPFRWKNLGFIASHLGLWLTVFCAGLGSDDLMRFKMDLYEGKAEWRAYDGNEKLYEMPFAIKLNDFSIEEFSPKLAVVENISGKIYEKTKPSMIMIEKNLQCDLHDWKVEVVEFLPSSGRAGDKYHAIFDFGAAPAAKVLVSNAKDTLSGWISCGSFNRPHESLKLDENYSLVMTVPEAKKFSSDVTIYTPDGEKEKQILEVNKPQTVNGWKIYQLSYDEKMGKYSSLSVVEVVRDPWQKWVYLGIYLMIIGAAYMFWLGNKKRSELLNENDRNKNSKVRER